jgi:hypothetical protein
MVRLRVSAIECLLLAGVLLSGGKSTEGQSVHPNAGQAQPEPLELTNSRTTGSFAVSPETLRSAPPVLALRFPRVVNPANTSFAIFVYLSYRPGEGKDAPSVKILLGNGSLYPADRPGGFLLRSSAAFAKLKAAKATDVRLVLEMKRLHPAEPWSRVEVTVLPPRWQSESSDPHP